MAYRQNDSQGRNDRVRFDLMEHIGVLSRKDNGWTREVNIVAWNDGPGKVDIREWDPDHTRMTKGVTLFEDEAEALAKVLARRYGLLRMPGFQSRANIEDRKEQVQKSEAGLQERKQYTGPLYSEADESEAGTCSDGYSDNAGEGSAGSGLYAVAESSSAPAAPAMA